MTHITFVWSTGEQCPLGTAIERCGIVHRVQLPVVSFVRQAQGPNTKDETLDADSYTWQDERTMWINSEVDALVRYTKGLQFPSVQAIRWENRRIELRGPTQVERGTMSLRYLCSDGVTRYFIRFEPTRQKWFLEAVDDSGLVAAGENLPPPPAFPPPAW